jgi:hypothetical protein
VTLALCRIGEDRTWKCFACSNTNIMITCLEVTDILNNEIQEFFIDDPALIDLLLFSNI